MLTIRLGMSRDISGVLAIPIDESGTQWTDGVLPDGLAVRSDGLAAEVETFRRDSEHSGAPGVLHALPRPNRTPARVLLVGGGAGDEAGWRAAGAALARAARMDRALAIAMPAEGWPVGGPGTTGGPASGEPADGADALVSAVRGIAEGLLLGAYRFRLPGPDRRPDRASELRRVTLLTERPEPSAGRPDPLLAALETARVVAGATALARDLTNMPSQDKSPAWFAGRVVRAAARRTRIQVRVREPRELEAEGFGGILAVGGGSSRGPRLVELTWRPPGAVRHVVLVGKGITFDTGGICIKPREGMKLMRKDMGGAAAVVGAALGAADLNLPVRITVLVPLAENMLGGDAYRPGDVVRHYGGRTSEIRNTDAEGRVVLGDALAYAARRLRPDVLVDLATLTGANAVALGKRTAALYSDNDELAGQLRRAARAAGEQVWRLPLPDDYLDQIGSDLADLANAGDGGAGSVTAALYLREFTGTARDRWAHLDMSAPAWAESADGELSKGATGWGVRTLLRWLMTMAEHEASLPTGYDNPAVRQPTVTAP